MRAVLVEPGEPGNLKLSEAPEPQPHPNQALIDVKAISLNLGEVRRARNSPAGTHLGWDLAGTIAKPAADGSGPKAGARVVGLKLAGAWAERAAVDTTWLAPIPDALSFAKAATLPVAGLTALYGLEQAGQLVGRRVLVTGASGGVGLFGIQLAKLSGATVTALVRREKHRQLVTEAGAAHVVAGERAEGAAPHGPFNCILESVGGQVLADCLKLLHRAGVLVNYGISSGEPASIEAGAFFRIGQVRYYGLYLFTEFGRRPAADGLKVLAELAADGRIGVHIDAEGGLGELGALAERLYSRQIPGKAVVHVD
jgi:NADPH:quinone reductase-like Zn-dependent oxidoreductase